MYVNPKDLRWFKFSWAVGAKTAYPLAPHTTHQETTDPALGAAPVGTAVILHRVIAQASSTGNVFGLATGAGVAYAGGNSFRNPMATTDAQTAIINTSATRDLNLLLEEGLGLILGTGGANGDGICVYSLA